MCTAHHHYISNEGACCVAHKSIFAFRAVLYCGVCVYVCAQVNERTKCARCFTKRDAPYTIISWRFVYYNRVPLKLKYKFDMNTWQYLGLWILISFLPVHQLCKHNLLFTRMSFSPRVRETVFREYMSPYIFPSFSTNTHCQRDVFVIVFIFKLHLIFLIYLNEIGVCNENLVNGYSVLNVLVVAATVAAVAQLSPLAECVFIFRRLSISSHSYK